MNLRVEFIVEKIIIHTEKKTVEYQLGTITCMISAGEWDELLQFLDAENDYEYSLRPRTIDEYVGQQKVKENLDVFISAARARREALDHVLLYGPPGLGKTTLAAIIANEMGVNIRVTSGPAIEKQGDLAALITNLS